MLGVARERFGDQVELVEASAEALPFDDDSFDHLTFTYLLRYVDDPAATLQELARVVRPGGVVASLEFGVPAGPSRPLWQLYVGRRAAARRASPCRRAGARSATSSAGRSATSGRGSPLELQLEWWRAAGHPRRRSPSAEPRQRSRHLGDGSLSTRARGPLATPLARGRLARLRHPPPPAVHRLAPLVRRHRRLPRAGRRLGTGWAPRSPRSRSRSGSARTRSTS